MGEEECFSAGPRTAWGCCKAGSPRGHSPDATQLALLIIALPANPSLLLQSASPHLPWGTNGITQTSLMETPVTEQGSTQ